MLPLQVSPSVLCLRCLACLTLVPALFLTSQVLVLTSLPAWEFILRNINYRPEGRAGVVSGMTITANKSRVSFPLLSCSFRLEVFSFPRSLHSCLLLIIQFSSVNSSLGLLLSSNLQEPVSCLYHTTLL